MIMPLPYGHAECFVCKYDAYAGADKPKHHDTDNSVLCMFRSGACPKAGVPFGDPDLEVVTCLKGVYKSLVFILRQRSVRLPVQGRVWTYESALLTRMRFQHHYLPSLWKG